MTRKSVMLTVLLCFAGTCVSNAQEVRASLSGMVSDPSGAPVPGAKVTVTHVGRNTSVVTDTNENGNYVTPFLEPGTYTLTVERAGFKRSQQRDIELQTLDRARVDVQLELGAVTDSVTVTTRRQCARNRICQPQPDHF